MGTLHLPDDGEDKVLNELDVLLTGVPALSGGDGKAGLSKEE